MDILPLLSFIISSSALMAQKNSELTQAQKKKLQETSAAGTPGQMKTKKPQKKKYSALISLLIVCLLFGGFFAITNSLVTESEVTISQFVQSYQSGKYGKIEVRDSTIIGTVGTPEQVNNPLAPTESVVTETAILPSKDSLKDIGIDISTPANSAIGIIDTSSMHFWADLAPTLIGTILFIGLFVLLMSRMMAGSGGGPMGFGKNKAKRYEPAKGKIMFNDVAGSLEEKQDLQEFGDFVKNPKKYQKHGGKMTRGGSMVEAPGTSKKV